MTTENFYQRLSEKLADLPDDPAFDTEGVWERIETPRRRVAGAWLWPLGLAASVLLVVSLWFFGKQPGQKATAKLGMPSPHVAQRLAAVPRWKTGTDDVETPRLIPRRRLSRPAAPPDATPEPVPETIAVLPDPKPPIPPSEVAVETTPQPEIAQTPGTVVLTIPVPGEDASPTRKPFVARLFRQWKRYNRGETVDWDDLGLKPLKLAKVRADSVRFAPRPTN